MNDSVKYFIERRFAGYMGADVWCKFVGPYNSLSAAQKDVEGYDALQVKSIEVVG